ncbi:MAG: DUF4249 domain-containing protein [Hymenobacter sp.]|nr:MAG: DUF4249 domain-containing protein [Hymenobacter sp.]
MKANALIIGALGLLFAVGGCVEPYMPAVLDAPASFLVVDGFINGNGRTRIKLARTANLSSTAAPSVEKGAKLLFADEIGNQYILAEKIAGLYQSDSLVLPTGHRYQLRISTTAGATYTSALVPLKVTPPIDNLNWHLNGSDIILSLSTHDPTQQARYYRWRTTETWQFNALYHSLLEYQDGIIKERTTPIYTCWRTEATNTISQGSSAQLSQDALTDVALLSFPYLIERFKIRYSLLVSQYAETAEEFAYLELLRKNTEAVGTVNDPLPTQLTGNVHRTDANPSEPVLGFVGAHTVQQKRIFIARTDLPTASDEQFESPYRACTIGKEILKDTLDARQTLYYPATRIFAFAGNIPLAFIIYPDVPNGTPRIQGYTGSSAYCADCRTRGTATKPIFW